MYRYNINITFLAVAEKEPLSKPNCIPQNVKLRKPQRCQCVYTRTSYILKHHSKLVVSCHYIIITIV